MPDLFDTTHVRDDPTSWDALAQRVAANATRRSRGSGFDWLAQARMSWIAASLLLAAAVAFMVLPAGKSSVRTPNAELQVLAPADDVGKAIVLREAPPAIGALLLSSQSGG
jgi:hypothetical protein